MRRKDGQTAPAFKVIEMTKTYQMTSMMCIGTAMLKALLRAGVPMGPQKRSRACPLRKTKLFYNFVLQPLDAQPT